MGQMKVSAMAIMDCDHLYVYCRGCGRRADFWDLIKHTKLCPFAGTLRQLDASGRPLFDGQEYVVVDVPRRTAAEPAE